MVITPLSDSKFLLHDSLKNRLKKIDLDNKDDSVIPIPKFPKSCSAMAVCLD